MTANSASMFHSSCTAAACSSARIRPVLDAALLAVSICVVLVRIILTTA